MKLNIQPEIVWINYIINYSYCIGDDGKKSFIWTHSSNFIYLLLWRIKRWQNCSDKKMVAQDRREPEPSSFWFYNHSQQLNFNKKIIIWYSCTVKIDTILYNIHKFLQRRYFFSVSLLILTHSFVLPFVRVDTILFYVKKTQICSICYTLLCFQCSQTMVYLFTCF